MWEGLGAVKAAALRLTASVCTQFLRLELGVQLDVMGLQRELVPVQLASGCCCCCSKLGEDGR